MKKVNLLYFSPTDTTKKVVRAVGETIGEIHGEYNISVPKSRKENVEFGPDDILVVGAPVYAGRVASMAMDYFKNVKGDNTDAVFITVYGNRDYEDALLELKDIFEAQGFIGVAAGAFVGEHSYTDKVAGGRPDSQDLAIAKDFGLKINEYLKGSAYQAGTYELKVKGNHPYKPGMPSMPPSGPKTEDKCVDCGTCSDFCPTGAISAETHRYLDGSACIKCFSCVKRCPVDAKFFDNPMIAGMKEKLEAGLSQVRKEPEFNVAKERI